jgi:hydrogenase maturation protease
MNIGVIGIGNSYAGDDGVGIETVRRFQNRLADSRVICHECERGGLDLVDLLSGFDSAVIVDAAQTRDHAPGDLVTFVLRPPFRSGIASSLHTMDLAAVLALGAMTGLPMPREVTVLAVEAAETETFRVGCSPVVRSVLPDVVDRLTQEVRRLLPDLRTVRCAADEAVV